MIHTFISYDYLKSMLHCTVSIHILKILRNLHNVLRPLTLYSVNKENAKAYNNDQV